MVARLESLQQLRHLRGKFGLRQNAPGMRLGQPYGLQTIEATEEAEAAWMEHLQVMARRGLSGVLGGSYCLHANEERSERRKRPSPARPGQE